MSTDRLYIYDPVTNSALCIAKGYAVGWASGDDRMNEFFDYMDNDPEFPGSLDQNNETRLELKTESTLQNSVLVFDMESSHTVKKGLFQKLWDYVSGR